MTNQLKEISGKLRGLSGFILIITFLLLGSCASKKAVYALITDISGTEQTDSESGSKQLSTVCTGWENSLSKINLAASETSVNVPFLTAIFLTGFFAISALSLSGKNVLFYRQASPERVQAVPVYLRNRLLRI